MKYVTIKAYDDIDGELTFKYPDELIKYLSDKGYDKNKLSKAIKKFKNLNSSLSKFKPNFECMYDEDEDDDRYFLKYTLGRKWNGSDSQAKKFEKEYIAKIKPLLKGIKSSNIIYSTEAEDDDFYFILEIIFDII